MLVRCVKPIIKRLVEGLDVEVDKMSSVEDDARNAVTSDTTVVLGEG